MAIGTNTFQTYAAIGNREDLIDMIENIAPTETWFTSNTGRTSAKAVYHEWQTDTLAAATANAHPEGEIHAAAAIVPTVRTGNYTQIIVKDFSVTETQEATVAAGRDSEIAYQKAKYLKELANDIEYALIINSAAVSGASATARQLKGVLGWITTNVTTATSATSASGLPETSFNATLQLIWAQGGKPSTVLVHPVQKRAISAYTGNNTRFNDIEGARIQSKVDLYMSDFGEVRIRLHRVVPAGTAVILGEMRLWRKAFLRQKGWQMMAKTGSFEHWHIESELTLESLQEKGSGKMTGFATA